METEFARWRERNAFRRREAGGLAVYHAQIGHSDVDVILTGVGWDSFPSGHTLTAFATGVLLTYLVKNKRWAFLLIFYGVMVGFSRMYLSEHFFEDVVAGSIMGVVLTILWIWFIENKKFIHSAGWNKGLLK